VVLRKEAMKARLQKNGLIKLTPERRSPKTQAEVEAMNNASPLDIEEMKRDLWGGGWTEIRHDTWEAPGGGFYRGPYKAWTIWAGVEIRKP
jgi:hypothetical protein